MAGYTREVGGRHFRTRKAITTGATQHSAGHRYLYLYTYKVEGSVPSSLPHSPKAGRQNPGRPTPVEGEGRGDGGRPADHIYIYTYTHIYIYIYGPHCACAHALGGQTITAAAVEATALISLFNNWLSPKGYRDPREETSSLAYLVCGSWFPL